MTRKFLPGRWPLIEHPVLVGLALFILALVLYIVVRAKEVFLLGFLSILIAALMSYPVNFLSRWIPRGIATFLTLLLFVSILIGGIALTIPTATKEGRQLSQQISKAVSRFEDWYASATQKGQVPSALPASPQALESRLSSRIAQDAEHILNQVIPAALSAVSLLSGVALVLILAAFWIYQPRDYFKGLGRFVPPGNERLYVELWKKLGTGLRHWVGGTLAAMTLLGSFTAIGLAVVGVESWPALAFLTFIGAFIPYVGAVSSAVPGLLVALSASPVRFLGALGVYTGAHLLEGYVIHPFIMRRAVELRPAVLLLWQFLMGVLFGILGIMIATPLLACLSIVLDVVYVEQKLGKRSSHGHRKADPERA